MRMLLQQQSDLGLHCLLSLVCRSINLELFGKFQVIPGPSVLLKSPPKGKHADTPEPEGEDMEEGEDYESKIVSCYTVYFIYSVVK